MNVLSQDHYQSQTSSNKDYLQQKSGEFNTKHLLNSSSANLKVHQRRIERESANSAKYQSESHHSKTSDNQSAHQDFIQTPQAPKPQKQVQIISPSNKQSVDQKQLPPPPMMMPLSKTPQGRPQPPMMKPLGFNGQNRPPPPQMIDAKKASGISVQQSQVISNTSTPKIQTPPSMMQKQHQLQQKSSFRSENSINQDLTPSKIDQQGVYVNLRDNIISQSLKIHQINFPILDQAKYFICKKFKQEEINQGISEEVLAKFIQDIHEHLMDTKDEEYGRIILDLKKQLEVLKKAETKKFESKDFSLQDQISNSMTQNLTDIVDPKKLKDEIHELKMKINFLESDLLFQTQKTKDLQKKYESDLDNLRNQLKSSQSEQFVKQKHEHKALIEDNARLLKQIKLLELQLQEEQTKVLELFEDAKVVRDEIQSEMDKFEKNKKELERMKLLNKNLRKKLNQKSIDFSDFDAQSEEEEGTVEKKQVQMQDVGISRASSLISLTQDFQQKIEGLIEEKSKSIAEVITKNNMNTYYQNYYYHPYVGQGKASVPTQYVNQNKNQQATNVRQVGANQRVFEMSLDESEGLNRSVDKSMHSQKPSSQEQSKKHSSSEISQLRSRIQEMRDKHIQSNQSMDPNIQPPNMSIHSNSRRQTHKSMSQERSHSNQRKSERIEQQNSFNSQMAMYLAIKHHQSKSFNLQNQGDDFLRPQKNNQVSQSMLDFYQQKIMQKNKSQSIRAQSQEERKMDQKASMISHNVEQNEAPEYYGYSQDQNNVNFGYQQPHYDQQYQYDQQYYNYYQGDQYGYYQEQQPYIHQEDQILESPQLETHQEQASPENPNTQNHYFQSFNQFSENLIQNYAQVPKMYSMAEPEMRKEESDDTFERASNNTEVKALRQDPSQQQTVPARMTSEKIYQNANELNMNDQ